MTKLTDDFLREVQNSELLECREVIRELLRHTWHDWFVAEYLALKTKCGPIQLLERARAVLPEHNAEATPSPDSASPPSPEACKASQDQAPGASQQPE